MKNHKLHVHGEIIEKRLGIPPDYQYKALHKSNFIQSNWHSNKLVALDYRLKLNKKIRVLDLGAGSGNFELIFGKKVKKITAVDYHEEALSFLESMLSKKKIKNVKLVYSDIRNLSKIKNLGEYDLVILIDVIEHIELDEADKMVRYLKTVLTPSGRVCVITPNYRSLWIYLEKILDRLTIVPKFGGHQHLAKYHPDNLKNLFEKNGFTTSSIATFNLLSFTSPIRTLSTILCKLELDSKIMFGNLLMGVFKNEKN